MSEILSSIRSMNISEWIAALSFLIGAFSFLIAALAFRRAGQQYRLDQLQQRAAQTREELQTIVGDCNRFLRPLGQQMPYPIVHTAAAITKEFCTRLGPSPQAEDVQVLLNNEQLVLSICVEGWIGSSQVRHMVDLAEEVEHKASSHNLQGKLSLICHASFLLAGLVAKVCSPEPFYEELRKVKPPSYPKAKVEYILNTITVDLQERICNRFFEDKGTEGISDKDAIQRSLYFIQTAAGIFINLQDEDLMHLAKEPWKFVPFYPETDTIMEKIERAYSLPERFEQVKRLLAELEGRLNDRDYKDLLDLIEPVGKVCDRCETTSERTERVERESLVSRLDKIS
jgi:hypothetical protein